MSHGSLVLFDQDWHQTRIDYRNGWGMAAAYEAAHKAAIDNYVAGRAGLTTNWLFWAGTLGKSQDEIFASTKTLPEAPRNLLLAIFWQPTLVAREHWPALVRYIMASFGHPLDHNPSDANVETFCTRLAAEPSVNHWGEIAKELHTRKDDPSLIACGFYLTSVNEWPFSGPRDPETDDETRPFTATDSWWFTPGPDPVRAPGKPTVAEDSSSSNPSAA